MNPHGAHERLHHFEVGGRDRGCRHNRRQRGISRRSAAPLKRGLGGRVLGKPHGHAPLVLAPRRDGRAVERPRAEGSRAASSASHSARRSIVRQKPT
jgi:hypothetical protein